MEHLLLWQLQLPSVPVMVAVFWHAGLTYSRGLGRTTGIADAAEGARQGAVSIIALCDSLEVALTLTVAGGVTENSPWESPAFFPAECQPRPGQLRACQEPPLGESRGVIHSHTQSHRFRNAERLMRLGSGLCVEVGKGVGWAPGFPPLPRGSPHWTYVCPLVQWKEQAHY